MKLSRYSWHYKLVYWTLQDEFFFYRISLCKYFWTVVGCILISPVMAIANGIDAIHWPEITIHWPKKFKLTYVFLGMAAGGIIYDIIVREYLLAFTIAAIIAIPYAFFKMLVYYNSHHKPKPKKEYEFKQKKVKVKKPNLLWEYLKARKAKVCPIIEWI